jgi:hypothetical protein
MQTRGVGHKSGKELQTLNSSPNVIQVVKLKRII